MKGTGLRRFGWVIAICLITAFIISKDSAFAKSKEKNESLEAQVAEIIAEEATSGKIKVGILDFTVSAVAERQLSEQELEDIGTQTNEELTSEVLKIIKEKGLKGKVSLIERERLQGIIEEKKLQTTGLTEKQATSIGGIAGLDVIVIGSIRITEDTASYTAKVMNVKDGEILGIAKQAEDLSGGILGQIATGVGILAEIAEGVAQQGSEKEHSQPQVLVNKLFLVDAITPTTQGWKFNSSGTLNIDLKANAVDGRLSLFVVDETNYWKFKAGEGFNALAVEKQITEADVDVEIPKPGTYYIIVKNENLLLSVNVSLKVSYTAQ